MSAISNKAGIQNPLLAVARGGGSRRLPCARR